MIVLPAMKIRNSKGDVFDFFFQYKDFPFVRADFMKASGSVEMCPIWWNFTQKTYQHFQEVEMFHLGFFIMSCLDSYFLFETTA